MESMNAKNEKTAREATAAYAVSTTQLILPPEWRWLEALNPEERTSFLKELIDAITTASQSGDWAGVLERITAWREVAEAREEQALNELRQQLIAEGCPPEVASLLGRYRGQISSVDTFIHRKQIEI